MNENERAVLTEELAMAMYAVDPGKRYAIEMDDGTFMSLDEPIPIPWDEFPLHRQDNFREYAAACIPAIERLLAAKSLDGMLAHLGRVKSLAMVYREYEQRYRTEVVVTTPEVDDETGNVVGRFNKTHEAFGGTRDESLRNVIAKAKGEKP